MAWWLTPRTPDLEVGVRTPLGSPCCVLEQDILTPPKVLVIDIFNLLLLLSLSLALSSKLQIGILLE